jgi:hypothetical protein
VAPHVAGDALVRILCSTVHQALSGALRVSFVLAVGLGTLCLTSPARACSQVERAIESSYPAPGATGVPTNVVLYAAGAQLGASGLSLETGAGVSVPITVRRVLPTGFDVIPAIELEPNQPYVLHHPSFSLLGGSVNEGVEFETGSGPAAPAVIPPLDLAGAAVLDGVESPCPSERLCLEPGGSELALFAANLFNNVSERSPGSLTGAYGNAFVPEDCLQIWQRDALGNRSEVVELCTADVTRIELSGDTASTTCDEYRHELLDVGEPDDPACTLTAVGASPSSRGALAAMFGLLTVLGMRRLVSRRERRWRSKLLELTASSREGYRPNPADGDASIVE